MMQSPKMLILLGIVLSRGRGAVVSLKSGNLNLRSLIEPTPQLDQWIITCKGNHSGDLLQVLNNKAFLVPPSSIIIWANSDDIEHFRNQSSDIISVQPYQASFKYNQSELFNLSALFKEDKLSWHIHLVKTSIELTKKLVEDWDFILSTHKAFSNRAIQLHSISASRLICSFQIKDANSFQELTFIDRLVRWFSEQRMVHWISTAGSSFGQISPRNSAAKMRTQTQGVLFGYDESEGTSRDWRRYPIKSSSTTTSTSSSSRFDEVRSAVIGGCVGTEFGCCASDGTTARRQEKSEAGCPPFSIRTGKPGLSEYGLDGSGELISVGDTGLDYTGCFFYDPEHTVPIFDDLTNATLSREHRKVAGYWALMDGKDKVGGHGTHVSGSTSGAFLPELSYSCEEAGLDRYNGMAPGAKILFTDLQCNTEGGCGCGDHDWCPCNSEPGGKCPNNGYLYPPPHLGEGYLTPLYRLGARINTNSWGSSCSSGALCSFSDDSRARDVDEFVFDHDDMLVLFAAGNDGDDNGFSSLDAQSYLKNGLSVGASTTTSDSMASLVNGADRLKPSSLKAVSCKPSSEEHDVCFSSSCACREETRANCSSSCESECSETCWGAQFDEIGELYVEVSEDLAYFSSLGPTSDGRWKPDLVAPGFYIASAHSTAGEHPCGAEVSCGMKPSLLQPPIPPANELFQLPSSGTSVFLNKLAMQTTNTLTQLSFFLQILKTTDENIQEAFDGMFEVEALVLESAEQYAYTWALNSKVLLNNGTSSSHITCSMDTWCQVTIYFNNVTLWANQHYLIGISILTNQTSGFNSYVLNRRETNATTTNMTSNHSFPACFGYWDSSYQPLNGSIEDSDLFCGSMSNEEEVNTNHGIRGDSFYPINLTMYASPVDTLRDHLTIMAGTSMATPVTAGNAAVVRQYFREGFFSNSSSQLDVLMHSLYLDSSITTSKEFSGLYHRPNSSSTFFLVNTRGGFSASAALVKAVLVNGAMPLSGLLCSGDAEIDLAVSMRSHVYEGYGRLSLSDSLALFNVNPYFKLEVLGYTARYAMHDVVNDSPSAVIEPIIYHDQVHEYCFEYMKDEQDHEIDDELLDERTTPLSVTLVWTDPSVSPAATHYLAHDLDLLVSFFPIDNDNGGEVVQKNLFRGNNNPLELNQIPDTINNMEKIRFVNKTLFESPDMRMKVSVIGSHVAYGGQKYSVVVSGNHLYARSCQDDEGKSSKGGSSAYIVTLVVLIILFLMGMLVYSVYACFMSYKLSDIESGRAESSPAYGPTPRLPMVHGSISDGLICPLD